MPDGVTDEPTSKLKRVYGCILALSKAFFEKREKNANIWLKPSIVGRNREIPPYIVVALTQILVPITPLKALLTAIADTAHFAANGNARNTVARRA